MNTREFDVMIVGGGPVGSAAAALLARHGGVAPARIGLLAPDLATAVDAPAGGPPDLRVSALSPASRNILQHADVWQRLPAQRLCRYERMRVWHESMPPDGNGTLQFDAAELAEPDLGVIAENRLVTQAGLASFDAAGGVTLPLTLQSIESTATQVILHTSDGSCRTRLVVGADGAHSQVRGQLGLRTLDHDYHQQAIVATIAMVKPHQHTAWQRFLAGGPLALLPLFDGQCSIVWSAPEARVTQLMSLPVPEFERQLTEAADGVLGAMRLTSPRIQVPLRRSTALRLVAHRGALIGDAAHQIHPLAGQGVNLGLLDAAALTEVVAAAVAEREDPGAVRVLRRYEQQRLTHDTLMSLAMSAFNTMFARGAVRGWVAARMLGAAAASGIGRRELARRAMGLAGELPRLAR